MLLINCTLVTNDAAQPVIADGALLYRNQLIEDLGSAKDLLARYPEEEKRDLGGKWLMPGMINAHTHIYSAYARGMAVSNPTRNFFEILENIWWALDRKLALEDARLNALTTMKESIRNGVTTIFDHHSSPHSARGSLFALADAGREIGIRGSYCYEVSDRDGDEIRHEEIAENVDFIRDCQSKKDDMTHGLFGMHASFTLSDQSMEEIKTAMAGIEEGYHIHVSEGIEDQYDSLHKYGKRVLQRLFDWDILGPRSLAIHCIHANGLEMDILRETDTSVVHNPMSNMGNACGTSPVVEMLRRGLRVGLGTDAYTNCMFESMKVAKILQSHSLVDPTVGFSQALALQFEGNPAICAKFFDHPLGVLKKGAYADLITVDYHPYTPLTEQNWGGHVLFGLNGGLVQDVIINGKEVMRQRELLTIDEEKLDAESRQRAAQIWPQM